MTSETVAATDLDPSVDFDVEGHGPFEQLQTWLSLRRPGRAGMAIRIVVAIGVAWAPLVVLTAISGKLLGPPASQPFWCELKLNAGLLIAMPLFALSMTPLYIAVRKTVLHFVRSGLIAREDVSRYHGELFKVARLRDSAVAQSVVTGLVLACLYGAGRTLAADLPGWAVYESGGARFIAPAGWWFTFVARPVLAVWLGMSVFRWVVYVVLIARLSRLPLRFVPTHPDGCGGMAFIGALPRTFGATVFGLSSVLAGTFATDLLWNGAKLDSIKGNVLVFVVTVVVMLVGPLILFAPAMLAARKQASLEYGALSSRHARLFEDRWIARGAPDDDLISAPEISTLCDIDAPLSRVMSMRIVPITRNLLVAVATPALLPLLPVVLIEVPFFEALKQLGGKLL